MMEHQGRRNPRLPEYDYSTAGAYFITVVIQNREPLLTNDKYRGLIDHAWRSLAERYHYVSLDEYVLMPNHLHGILWIEDIRRGRSGTAPSEYGKIKRLGSLIGAFKTMSTREINLHRSSLGVRVWQPNYYEHIVRSEDELNRIRQYIIDNPAKWNDDPYNPDAPLPVRVGPFPNGPYEEGLLR